MKIRIFQFIIILTFFNFSSAQELKIKSVKKNIINTSTTTINKINQLQIENVVNIGIWWSDQFFFFDLNNDGFKDLIKKVAGDPYKGSFFSVYLWDNNTNQYIEREESLIEFQGESFFITTL